MGLFVVILFPEVSGNDAWLPERLEYQFTCSTPVGNNENILSAEEYYHGHLIGIILVLIKHAIDSKQISVTTKS